MIKLRHVSLLVISLCVSIIPTVFMTSCAALKDYSLYYRAIDKYRNADVGLDISLFEVDFSSFVLNNTDLQAKLNTLNNSSNNYGDDNAALDYIGYRTFTFAGATKVNLNGSFSLSVGTGWIISRDLTDTTNEYTYWVMTNRHVTNDWLNNSSTYDYVFWNTVYSYQNVSDSFDINSYQQFDKNIIKMAPESIAQINIPSTNPNQLISKFNNGTTPWQLDVTSAGFPWTQVGNDQVCNWKFEDNSKVSTYYLQNQPAKNDGNLYYEQNSYVFIKNTFSSMDHGASGSMVIDNSTKNVLGIYWGWFMYVGTQDNYPCAVIFNTSGHSDLKHKWVEYNKLDVISTIVGVKIY